MANRCGIIAVSTVDNDASSPKFRRRHIVRLAVFAGFLPGLFYLVAVKRVSDVKEVRRAVSATEPAAPLTYVVVSDVLGALFVPGPLWSPRLTSHAAEPLCEMPASQRLAATKVSSASRLLPSGQCLLSALRFLDVALVERFVGMPSSSPPAPVDVRPVGHRMSGRLLPAC